MAKKVCAASDLSAFTVPSQIADCASASAAIGEVVYYVLTVINASPEVQDITLTDPMPAGFVPIPGVQCLGTVFTPVPPVWAGSIGPGAVPPGQSETCIIPGYFTEAGSKVNTASFAAEGQQSETTIEGGDSALIFVDPTKPLPDNLSIEKTADVTVVSLNNGPVTVTYTITVTNTGAGDLYTGGYLQVVDNVAALPSSGVSFGYTVDSVTCTPSTGTTSNPGTPLCPTEISGPSSGNTTNQSNGAVLGVWQFNTGEDGLIPAGESFTITYTVTYREPEGCIEPGTTLNGVQNTAFIRFATGQMAFSDMNMGDNTSSIDLEITDHGIDEDCPVLPPDELVVEKIQKDPSSGIVPWGSPVEYRIIVSNPVGIGQTGQGTGPTIQNIAVTDLLVLLPGMPNVAVTTTGIACLTNGLANCTIAPAAPFTTTMNQLSVQVAVANVTVLSLADGEYEEISVILEFKPLSCVSYSSGGLQQTANFGKIDYTVQTPVKNGFSTSQHSALSAPVITDHDKTPDCTLKVEKTGPDQILFGQPFTYNVSYQNYGSDPIDIGTLLDGIAIDVSNYAASLDGTYTYACSIPLPNLFQNVIPPTNFSIGFNSDPAQGTRLLQTLDPALPVPLPGMTTMDCVFTLTLDQPAADNPYCMGAGNPQLVNAALMDVSHYFNTNLPVPPQAYATTAATLPLCRHVSVTKTISPSVVAPDGLATVTLRFYNHSDDPIAAGATLTDVLDPRMVYTGNTCALCPTLSANYTAANGIETITAVFGPIPAHSYGEVLVTVKLRGPAPSIVPNTVTGIYEPPPGNWYDQSPTLTDKDIIGVFDLFPVQISKSVVNTAPGQPPNGPFLFAVNCTYAFGGYSFSFSGTASVTLPNATATVMGANGTPLMVPVGAVCTFTETGLPGASGGYGFSAVGYSPAAPGGAAGQLTVVADDRNEGVVENCHGPAAANPLTVPHVVGADCPPVPIVELPLQVRKVVVSHAPYSVAGMTFPVMVECSSSPGTQALDSLQDGETKPFFSYTAGATCTVSEGTIPVTDACGPGMLPVWTQDYAPSNIVPMSPDGTLVTITNTLNCEEADPQGRLMIRKSLDTTAAPGANVAGLTFPVSLTCGGTVQTGQISLNAPWSVGGLSTNAACTVAEDVAALPVAGVCPQGQTASWGVSYIPANASVTPTVAGASVVVVNTLKCSQVLILRKIPVRKVVISYAPGSVAGLVFPITSTCGPNTTSPHSPKTFNTLDGQTKTFTGMQGDTCTITEGAYPVTAACGKKMTPVWTTTITPSPTLSVAATNPLVTVTNTLNCRSNVIVDGGTIGVIDILPDPRAFPAFDLTKTCQPAVPVAGATYAQAVCIITVTQTAGAPVGQITVTETLMSGATGAQIISLNGQGWSFPALPVAANLPVLMHLPGAALTGTPPQSAITAVVQLPEAAAATGSQNCVSLQGMDPDGLELATAGPVCAALQNGAATVVQDPNGDGPALELTHTLAGPCRDDREKQTYTCLFTLDVTNPSDVDFVGPEVISQSFGDIRPMEVSGKGEGWDCTPGSQNATCVNAELALLPGGKTAVDMTFVLPAQRDGGQFTTCARLGIPEDGATRILLAQQAAQAFGLDVGQPDGVMGPRTRVAVSEMQERLGLPVTGEPDMALFKALGLRLDKGVAPICATADLPPMAAPDCRKGEEFVAEVGCQPIRKPDPKPAEKPAPRDPEEGASKPTPLQCDPATTVLRNGECKCRKEGTVKLSESTCG